MSNLRKLISCGIVFSLMLGVLPVHAAPTDGPSYQAVGKVDIDGLTDNLIYTYPSGTKDASPSDYLLMVNGAFISADVVGGKGVGNYIPARAVADALGAAIDWDEQSKAVTFKYNEVSMTLTLGKTTATVNGKEINVSPCFIQNSRFFMGVDTMSEFQVASGYIPPDLNNIAYNPVIWVDSQTQSAAPEQILEWLKPELQKGLDSFKANLLIESYHSQERINEVLTQIQADIDNTVYVEQIGRYTVFKGPYTILVDYNTKKIYMYHSGNAWCSLVEADMNDPDIFVADYLAG